MALADNERVSQGPSQLSTECSVTSTSQVDSLICQHLRDNPSLDSLDLANQYTLDHQLVVGAMKGLEARNPQLIQLEQKSFKKLELSDEGKSIVRCGSHEYRIWESLGSNNGLPRNELSQLFDKADIGFAKAMRNGWICLDRATNIVRRKVSDVVDDTMKICSQVASGNGECANIDKKLFDDLKKRKIISEVTVTHFVARKGPEFLKRNGLSGQERPLETDLTLNMVSSGSWRTSRFKAYNMEAKGITPNCGCLHPLTKVRAYFRQVFLEMGFEEMPTSQYVESSFWNFDALFQPQQHPARDIQDTFFLAEPESSSDDIPTDYMERVRRVHSTGDYGSTGYQYDWKISEARKNILRTHTTAVSARMLYKLAQKTSGFEPVKYFSIDKVFRNENMDATHLAEFHQVEGLIADYDLTIADLISALTRFYARIGIHDLKFKPSYNPYTEPSMEIFCYHEGLKKLMEVGNSGIFRPEMLLPMGLPANVKVIAWGLSLERPAMILSGISNIRDLVGHKVNMKICHNTPFCNYGY